MPAFFLSKEIYAQGEGLPNFHRQQAAFLNAIQIWQPRAENFVQ